MGKLKKRKIISLYLCIALIMGCFCEGISAKEAYGGSIIFIENGTIRDVSVTTGSIINIDKGLMALEDGRGIIINTDGDNKLETNIEFGVQYTTPQSIELKINMALKTARTTNVSTYLYNYNINAYENINTTISNTSFKTIGIDTDTNRISEYIQDGIIKLRLTCESDLELDYCLPQISYYPDKDSQGIKSYTAEDLIIEQGNIDSGNLNNLRELDKNFIQISSADNKVAWYTKMKIDETPEQIRGLKIYYDGKTSLETNNIWISLYRNDTKNWEVITNVKGTNEGICKEVLLSDTDEILPYIADNGVLKIRVYNSSTQNFVQSTDLLNADVIYDTNDTVEWLDYEEIIPEYGNITSSQGEIIVESDKQNKVAIKAKYYCNINKNQIYSISVLLDTTVSQAGNNQYLSLYNYKTKKFTVFREKISQGQQRPFVATINDPMIIEDYISESGEIICRIYNSASKAFTRSIKDFKVVVEYTNSDGFEIAQLSDVHELIGHENFKSIINEVNQKVKPDFTIVSGDVTDHGTEGQYNQYMEDLKLFDSTLYTLPGNHDVRWWNSNGKNDYINKVGPLYQCFEHKGIYFMLLDSTVTWELDGKISKAQIGWIKEQLGNIPKDAPIILFAHHPFKMNNNVTARHELFEAFNGYNVIAFMAGHLHYYGNIKEDGIPTNYITYIKDNNEQNYVTIKFTPRNYYIYQHKASDGSKVLWQAGNMNNRHENPIKDTDITLQDNGDVKVKIETCGVGVSKIQARIDNYGPYTQLQKNGALFEGTIQISQYNPKLIYGKHFIGIELFDSSNEKWTEYKDYEWQGGNTKLKWVLETDNMIQSTPTYDEEKIYVGSQDSNIYCINAKNGEILWTYQTGDMIMSKPGIGSVGKQKIVVVGSGDKKVYGLDGEKGTKIWEYQTGGSVFSDPLIVSDTVYIGSGDGKIYALDLEAGNLKWSYQAGGLIRQRPTYYDGTLYANIRDTFIWYAIDAKSGQLQWRGNANTDESYFVCGDIRPIIVNNKLWCIDAQNIRPGYLDIATGNLAWTADITNVSSRGMATNGKYVFYASNSGRQIYAIDAITNQIVWEKDLRYMGRDSDLQEMQIDSALICEGDIIYHVAERGRITAMSAKNGTVLWQYDAVGLPERVFWSTPEVINGNVYLSGIDGNVYCISNE